jgi:hypothetical protein
MYFGVGQTAVLAPISIAGSSPRAILELAVTPNNTLLATHSDCLVALVPASTSEQEQSAAAAPARAVEPMYRTQVLAGQIATRGQRSSKSVDGIGPAARFSGALGLCVVESERAVYVCDAESVRRVVLPAQLFDVPTRKTHSFL